MTADRPDGRPRSLAGSTAPAARALARVPKPVVLIAVAAVLVAGLIASGPLAFALLGALAVFLGWLLLLAWPVLTPTGRLVRSLVVLLVLGVGVSELMQ